MLLQKINKPFDSEEYLTELKLDGIRLLLSKFDNKVRLYTRHQTEVTSLFPEIYEGLNIPDGTVLDGELIVPDEKGKPDFEAVMQRFQSKSIQCRIQYCIFDVIYFNNKNITSLPLLERKQILAEMDFDTTNVVPVQWIIGNGLSYFNAVKDMNLEGIVLKKKDSKYEINKRSDRWLKVINYKYQDVLITGMIKKDKSFLLGSVVDGKTIGTMEFIPINERKKIYSSVKKYGVNESEKLIIFKKTIPCNVKFRNWTSNGKLRIPSFCKWVNDYPNENSLNISLPK